jgi:hypothetical protein
MPTVPDLLRHFAIETLSKYENQISVCLEKLSDDQIWGRDNEYVNSIGNLVLHLDGNLGQYVISAVGGAPDKRERDLEFNATGGIGSTELRARLGARVAETTEVIRSVPDERLTEEVLAQNKPLPIGVIIFKVVEHFALHTGQIMLRTKQLTANELGFTTHKRAGH